MGSGGSMDERVREWEWEASTVLDRCHLVAAGRHQEEA